jgi:glycerol uptake facilitator-like aquaporin
MMPPLSRRLATEFVGTAFLLMAIVGSGIMAETFTADPGLQLLENALATAAVLAALILAFGSVSGAHFNPAVTLADRAFGGLSNRDTVGYIGAQITGGIVGVMLANLMFDLPAITLSTTARSGSHLWLAEGIATLGLLLVIFGVVKSGRSDMAAFAVGAYIAGAVFFTSSTAFANPAITIARTLTDTFAGISPASVPAFVIVELIGTALAIAIAGFLFSHIEDVADQVVVPHTVDEP